MGAPAGPRSESALNAVLGDVATIGTFFAVAHEAPAGGRHRVLDLADRPDLLDAEVAHVRHRLAERAGCPETRVEARVAASILYQGLASRLLSPVIGAALCHGRSPDPAALCWFPRRPGPLSLALAGSGAGIPLAAGQHNRVDSTANLVRDHVFNRLLAPIGTALRARIKIAPRLLWGNTASSLAGAVRTLAQARPRRAEEAYALAARLLAEERLAGLGDIVQGEGGARRHFVRSSCCLYYRVPGSAKCGDCALLPGQSRRAHRPDTPGPR